MKPAVLGVAIVVLLAAGSLAYVNRADLRSWWQVSTRPSVPEAVPYMPGTSSPAQQIPGPPSVVEGGMATSAHYALESSPTTAKPAVKKIDPFAEETSLPSQANLAVPFTTQSPTSAWTVQDEESCEEASMLMVDSYYRGVREISKSSATASLNAIVAYEKRTLGFYEDTAATTTAQLMRGFYGYTDVRVVPYDLDKMKRAVANGYPVILPTSGKLLKNPNFKNGGPPYHMVVVKGFLADGSIITNDPGTRNGKDYLYSAETLATAVHDWNNGNVIDGAQLMIIVLPKS